MAHYMCIHRLEEISEALYKRSRRSKNLIATRGDGFLTDGPNEHTKHAYLKINGKHYKGFMLGIELDLEAFRTYEFHDIHTTATFKSMPETTKA